MSINRNFTRTLSGANTFTIDNLELASHKNTIRINGNSGNAGDVLGKDENNKLVFTTLAPFIIDPNSIDGSKLKDNISITTTGNYSGNSMELTGNLQVDNDVTIDGNLIYAGDLNIDDLVVDSLTLDENFVGNGNINLNQHQIVGDYVNLNINGDTGSIICFQLTTKDSMLVEDTLGVTGLITGGNGLTLTSGNIQLNTGSINLTAGNVIASAGDMECVDFEATGDITGGNDITIIGDYSSTDGNLTLTNGNISCIDLTATNGLFDDIRLPKTGTAVITINGTNGNINTSGNFTTTAGNIHTSSGNIFTATGDIHANGGYVRGDELRFLTQLQLGNSASPTFYIDSSGNIVTGSGSITSSHTGSYASNDFALELTEANSHAKIGGNLKVDGTIYGTVVGDVSETHINGQSLRIHDLGDESGDTGIQVEDGYDIRMYSDAGTTKTIELDSSSGDITITGTLYGNVDGNVSEDHINGQSLTIENLGSLGDTGIEIHDGYDLSTYSDGGKTKTFAVDGATGDYSSKNGDITLTNGDITLTNGNIIMNNGLIRNTDTTSSHMDLDFDNGVIAIRNGTGGTETLMSISNQFITIKNKDYPSINGTQISDTFYRLNDSTNGSVEPRVLMDSVDGLSLLTGQSLFNLTLSPSGNITFESNSGEIIGRDAGSSSSNDTNTTNMRNIRIDESCFKYDTREIAMSKPTSRIEKKYTTTSTAWSEINDQLYVKLKTNNMSATNFIVEWSYYAVKDDGSRMWGKLFDIDATSPEDIHQPAYLNNTKQVLFDGGSDKTGQHHATFTLRNVSANVDKNIGVCIWTVHNSKSYIYFYLGPVVFNGNPPTGGLLSAYAFGGMTLQIKKMYDGGATNSTPTGWSPATSTDLMTTSIPSNEKLMSYSYIDNDAQNYVRIYNTANKFIFNGSQDSGTDTLEVHFTANTTTGYLEFGFYANTLTAGMIFHCGVAVATGGTSPFSTTLGSSAVSIDGYKLGLFNGDTSRYSLKEILDFTSYENTYLTSKFHFNNLTVGTEYKMALYGRCNYSGSIYINAGGKSTTGTANRSAHQPAFLKFYEYDSNLLGSRTDDEYVSPF